MFNDLISSNVISQLQKAILYLSFQCCFLTQNKQNRLRNFRGFCRKCIQRANFERKKILKLFYLFGVSMRAVRQVGYLCMQKNVDNLFLQVEGKEEKMLHVRRFPMKYLCYSTLLVLHYGSSICKRKQKYINSLAAFYSRHFYRRIINLFQERRNQIFNMYVRTTFNIMRYH